MTAVVAVPALVRGDELITATGLFGRVIERAKEIETGPGGLSAALKAGVGGTVFTTLGGRLDPGRYRPRSVQARVRLLADGKFRSESFGEEWNAGPTAVLVAGNVTWVVGSRAVSLYDRSYFLAHGQDPRRYDCVVIKSPHCQHHMYADWCARMINIDAPGSTSANLPYLGHFRCARPIFPLDPDVAFTPRPKSFRRA